MHRYQPRIHLVQLKAGQKVPTTPAEMQTLKYKTFVSEIMLILFLFFHTILRAYVTCVVYFR